MQFAVMVDDTKIDDLNDVLDAWRKRGHTADSMPVDIGALVSAAVNLGIEQLVQTWCVPVIMAALPPDLGELHTREEWARMVSHATVAPSDGSALWATRDKTVSNISAFHHPSPPRRFLTHIYWLPK